MVLLSNTLHNGDPRHSPCDPSPEQIRERAFAIREQWSERTRSRRRINPSTAWLAPLVRTDDIVAAANNN